MNVANNNKPMNIMDMHVENYAPLSDGGPSNQEKQYYPYSHIGCDVLLHAISMNVIMIG